MIAGLDLQTTRPKFETEKTLVSRGGSRRRTQSASKKASIFDEERLAAEAEKEERRRAVSAETEEMGFDDVENNAENEQKFADDDEELAVPEFRGLWFDDQQKATVTHVASAGPEKKEGPPKKSKLEQEMMARSMELLKQNAVQRQIAAGREFKGGSAFYSAPKTVLFKDIEVGQTYKRKVVLTNVTYSLNTCKFISLSENLKNFVQIDFNPPGHISAGMTCDFTVTFAPQLDCDLSGEIKFLAATGPFSIPFQALTKKCIISCSFSNEKTLKEVKTNAGGVMCIDYGSLVIHGITRRTLTLLNTGALPTDFQIAYNKQSGGDEDFDFEEFAVEKNSLLSTEHEDGKTLTGVVPSFGSIKIDIAWEPKIPNTKSVSCFVISFGHPENPPITVVTKGFANDIPVHFERNSVDLRICTYNRLFQDSIALKNTAKTALRLTFMIPPAIRNHLDILPHTGYIQAESSFSAQIKFFPKPNLVKDLACTGNKYFDPETGVLEVPLTCQVADQVL